MPLPKGLPWGDSFRGLHQQCFRNLEKYGKLKMPMPSTSASGSIRTAQHTKPPNTWPYTEVSWYLPDEVMFNKEMKQRSKTQWHSVKQRLQSGLQKLIACPQNQHILRQYRVHTGGKGDSPAESAGLLWHLRKLYSVFNTTQFRRGSP